MKDNIVDQLNDALELFEDYPRIETTLDIKRAQEFLSGLSKCESVLNAPSFDQVDTEEVKQEVQQSSLEDWLDALNNLRGVFATDDDRNDPNEIIWGAVDKYPNAKTNLDEFYLEFCQNNKAYFGEHEGTWAEIYELIVEHVNENLTVPELPEQND